MNHILAKISKKFYKLISDETLFNDMDFNDRLYVEYDPDHNLDEECWFKIAHFSQKDFCLEILKNEFDSKEYNEIPKEQFNNIKFILSIQNSNYLFQKITPSLFIQKKYISFGECAKLVNDTKILTVNSQPDAIYFKDKDVLIFKNIATISSIFKGIDVLYREATNEDVKSFLENDFIKLNNNFSIENVSKPNRKRIAMALDSLSKFSEDEKNQIVDYIKEYCSNTLIFDNTSGAFEISTDEQLKTLLYGIEQRYYTTSINNEKRLANSIVKL
ncbi:ATP F0F1 synthase synthase [Glaesserella parasuis]|uniref:ATP F0F1 synthase synthase n=1 Tax=Glaesserella parasuis TaxID=738 RepID=UPI00132C1A3E|nr:ATP F0F1 synthase synthase [Glaesserella parasuis]MWP99556.1 ATP F0F1 synthase synthase [Glaesserella parasuis]MWQ44987.1 ATP F0F1 synthase synthase [Glaesserella parasuis]MWQ61254.1 ATP F0F1 synthase synthase [Glaesserella parasuis]